MIHIPAVPYAIVLDNKIGYLPVQRFNETAAEEVQTAVARLQKEGVKGIILDMRGNPGGILDQSIAMSNLFLKIGPGDRQRAVAHERHAALHDRAATPCSRRVPLTVLTDEGTASASEIVAGALQDHDRALVVGSTSFGKGLVQTLFPLDGGYALKITTAKWYTPSGRSIQRERKFVNGRFVEDDARLARDGSQEEGTPGLSLGRGPRRVRRRRHHAGRPRARRHAHDGRADAGQGVRAEVAGRLRHARRLRARAVARREEGLQGAAAVARRVLSSPRRPRA